VQLSRIRPTRKHLKFMISGVTTSLVGYLILIVFVEELALAIWLAAILQSLTTYLLNFSLHRYFTWRGKQDNGFWTALRKFYAGRLAMMPVKQVVFFLFVFMGIPYLLANFMNTLLFAGLNFQFNNRLVFGAKKEA